jgi:hypothetical protein
LLNQKVMQIPVEWANPTELMRLGSAVKFLNEKKNTGTYVSARNYRVLPRYIFATTQEQNTFFDPHLLLPTSMVATIPTLTAVTNKPRIAFS